MRRIFGIATLIATVGLAGSVTAQAAGPTAVLHGTSEGAYFLSVVAAPGAENALSIGTSADGSQIVVRDTRAGVVSETARCVQQGPMQVRCRAARTGRIEVASGDMADRFTIDQEQPPAWDLAIDTGGDDDSVRLGFKPADPENSTVGQITIDTGAGNDALAARAVLTADQPPVATIVQVVARMGEGNDRAALGLLGTTYGGTGADYLVGGDGAQTLYGEGGRDRIDGGAGGGDHCDGGDDPDVYGPGCETAAYNLGDTGTHEVGHWPGRR